MSHGSTESELEVTGALEVGIETTVEVNGKCFGMLARSPLEHTALHVNQDIAGTHKGH